MECKCKRNVFYEKNIRNERANVILYISVQQHYAGEFQNLAFEYLNSGHDFLTFNLKIA